MKLKEGIYLVGREDGTVDSFFVRVTEDMEVIGPPRSGHLIDRALDSSKHWWWRRMLPTCLPTDAVLAQMPPHHHEDRKG